MVLYSAPFFPLIGGMEEFARNLAIGLHDLGCAVNVVTDTASDRDNPLPFPVHRTTALAEKAKLFAEADVVLFVGVRARETLKSLRLRQRLILTHHGTYVVRGQLRTLIMGPAKRLLSRLFTNVSVSKYVARKIGGRQTVIHNCFDDTVFVAGEAAGRPPGSFVFCGRLVSDKGCDLAIRALAEVRRANRAATLTIIGDGPEKGPLMQLAQALGVSDAVTFTGALPFREVAARLRAHRCTVVPSIWEEPFGIVVLEGLASGCEVIVTDRGGLPEALGGLGWAVDATVEALAAAMLAVCEGESRRGAGVAHWLRAHSREAIARQYLDVIRKRLA